ncbi:MAG: L-histidine N(alpha)-methyltransferase [Elusimicrobiota bacterium]
MVNFTAENQYSDSCVKIENCLKKRGRGEYIDSVLAGLENSKKSISSMFFYDEKGSKLFEQITGLPEYYLTRTEKNLIRQAAFKNRQKFRNADIIEIGSGDYSKISILLDAVPPGYMESLRYIPVDVSYAAIKESADKLLNSFPGLNIHALVADFINQLDAIPKGKNKIICFFGSTLGNFTRKKARNFILNLGKFMEPGDMLFIGLDMVKDIEIIEKAYNDSSNVTANFNLNILKVVNKIAGTDFDPESFRHLAFYNKKHSRIEMHLQAKRDMVVSSPLLKEKIFIEKNETIHTENSHKFSEKDIYGMAEYAGLKAEDIFYDKNKWFSLVQFYKK